VQSAPQQAASITGAAPAAAPALFLSDLHLSDDHPETVAAFLGFLAGPARQAASVWILGDLFEYWAGDDDLAAPLNATICEALRALADTGVQLAFMRGNRDVLIGSDFAQAAGLRLLSDPCEILIDGHRLLLSHGDALCTDDRAYQAYRRQVQDADWQRAFLARPLAERKAFIESLRQRSEEAKREKTMAIMDVNPDAVAGLLRAHGEPLLIHGHTHRPAQHHHVVEGKDCERWVLPDWHDSARYLEYSHGGLNRREWRPA